MDRDRDRDEAGRARNARPRDGLGRPLPRGAAGVAGPPEGVPRTAEESLAEAQRLLDAGRPFHAHEVLEDAWKSAPGPERALWKGLTQLAVGLTHAARGNAPGAVSLLRRGAERLTPYRQAAPHGIAAAALHRWALDLAAEIETGRRGTHPAPAPALRGGAIGDHGGGTGDHGGTAGGRHRLTGAYRRAVELLHTPRLVVRGWEVEDAEAALEIYGAAEVTRWLTPAMDRVADIAAMRSVLQAWTEAQHNLAAPRGRWAIQLRDGGEIVGGLAIRLLPRYREDLELSWQLKPQAWGHGYAVEAGRALIRWAFTQEIDELFAAARPNNARAIATARRLGMEWVGETTKYYGLRLQVFRIRPSDLIE